MTDAHMKVSERLASLGSYWIFSVLSCQNDSILWFSLFFTDWSDHDLSDSLLSKKVHLRRCADWNARLVHGHFFCDMALLFPFGYLAVWVLDDVKSQVTKSKNSLYSSWKKKKFAFYLVLFYLLVERVNSMSQSNLLRFIMCLGFLNLYLKVLNKMVIE